VLGIFRSVEAAAANFPDRGLKRTVDKAGPSASPKPKRRKKKKDTDDDSEVEDEVTNFKSRPSAAVNKPMTLYPVDRTRKSAIDLSLATIDPNASFADRVAQFDNMEAIAKKRESSPTVSNGSAFYQIGSDSSVLLYSYEPDAGRCGRILGEHLRQAHAFVDQRPRICWQGGWHVSPAVELVHSGKFKKKKKKSKKWHLWKKPYVFDSVLCRARSRNSIRAS
jgi:hypothetical protein